MIYITGDTHGEFERLGSRYLDAGENDTVIICGDFGGVWDDSSAEHYWRKWLASKPFTTLFVDGNHENYDLLRTFPVEEWHGGKVHRIAPNVLHLLRGQIFNIDGIRFFTFGGASSHDIDAGILEPDDPDFKAKKKRLDMERALYRIDHVSWWKDELPSEEEMEEGLKNLEAAGSSVDVVLSHCAPTSVQDLLSSGLYRHDILTDYLETIKERTEFQTWFFGHYHDDRMIGQHFVMLYEKIVELDDFLRNESTNT